MLETTPIPAYEEGSRRDAQAFATADLIVQILTRTFFSAGPLLLFRLMTEMSWMESLLLALLCGFLCEAQLKRLLAGADSD